MVRRSAQCDDARRLQSAFIFGWIPVNFKLLSPSIVGSAAGMIYSYFNALPNLCILLTGYY